MRARYSSVCNVLRQWRIGPSLLVESTDSMIIIILLLLSSVDLAR